MGQQPFLQSRIGRAIGPAIGICAIGYFAFHATQGDRGIIALSEVRAEVQQRRAEADIIHAEREVLERRVQLLHPESLDRDMLDERARAMLNLGRHGEAVILLED